MDILLPAAGQFLDQFWDSDFFFWIKMFLAVYIAVILVDLVLLMVLRGLGGDMRTIMKGASNIPTGSKNKMQKQWEEIRQYLKKGDPSLYKVAILEADKIANEILKGVGYDGNNMGERLAKVKPGQLDNLEDLQRAHQVRNRVIYEKDFDVDRQMAEEIIVIYQKFLENLQFI